jgi:pentatricopeptide repeat protein
MSVNSSNSNVILATSIIEMYAKCGSFNIATQLFDKMPKRNIIARKYMINAYNQYESVECLCPSEWFGIGRNCSFLSIEKWWSIKGFRRKLVTVQLKRSCYSRFICCLKLGYNIICRSSFNIALRCSANR